jgi:hypothetical protein
MELIHQLSSSSLHLQAVNSFIPMDPQIKQILNVVIIVAVVLWLLFLLLSIFGLSHVKIPGG